MVNKALFSKATDDWATPPEFYNELCKEFAFDFDPCPLNADFDGLDVAWYGNIFINSPYSNIRAFLEKGIREKEAGRANLLVYLIPARTDTRWFHDLIYGKAEIRFIKGRLKFGGAKNSAPFPSMLCIFEEKYDTN